MEETTIICGDFLWDGISESVLPKGAVLIEKGIVQAVGAIENLIHYAHDRLLDFPGTTLMPGLIDCHTHLSMDPTMENYLDHMSDPVPVLTLRAAAMMKKDLHSGVTTCRCCGDKEFLDIACREAVLEGLVDGPHLVVATRGIRAPHGHGFVGYPFDGIRQIRNAIQENVRAGADFIKIYITGTLRGDSKLPSFLSREEIKTAIEESHLSGLRIGAHCVGGIGMDWALELGLDSLEHAYHISDDQIDHLLKTKTGLVLTPSPILMDERVNHLPARLIPGHVKEKEMIAERMTAIISAGVPFAVGTDGMHGELTQEIVYLEELGASRLEALKSATLHGAKVCGIDDRTGSLETGKDADLIALEGNPFKDLSALDKVKAVWKQGQQQRFN